MASNSVVIEGSLGRDPEKRGNENGPVTFSICWNKNRQDKITGEWEKTPHWFDVIVWGYQRDKALTLRKGNTVVVAGKLETTSWEDKDGNTRKGVQIVADSLGAVPFVQAAESDW